MISRVIWGKIMAAEMATAPCCMHMFGGVSGKMSPEEIDQELSDIKKMLIEIKAVFDHFTTEKKQRWKDESARRRERCW